MFMQSELEAIEWNAEEIPTGRKLPSSEDVDKSSSDLTKSV